MKKFFPILLVLLFVLPAFAQEEVELSEAEADRIKAELDADEETTGLSREELVEKYNSEAAELKGKAEPVEAENEELRARLNDLEKQIQDINAEARKYEIPVEPPKKYDTYVVIEGDCLWMIAENVWGWRRCAEWPRIYDVNKDLIKDPDLIFPGWELNIPLD
ncbi:LysM peptidoglycan-binding domain-containing protein [bacterium]|nr:LysM peptidoglycan-binding domain-containing protein [bacterium]